MLILGVHIASEGYPNTLYRLQCLKDSEYFDLSEINLPIWDGRLKNKRGVLGRTCLLLKTLYAHLSLLMRYLATEKPDIIYIPYPAVFVLFLLSLLPSRMRPGRVLADGFISLYDTIINDRKLIGPQNPLAHLLKHVEQRAYHFLDRLIVDTPQNAQFICSLFDLPVSKVLAIPLSTDETHFKYDPYEPKPNCCEVLFIGTLVPLHGIATILEAARLLDTRSDIRFKLVGDGQDAPIVEKWLQNHSLRLTWQRQWQSSGEIAKEIMQADICLGIFGISDKTQRVCPFKLYAYAAVGRPIVTGQTEWLMHATKPLTYQAFVSVPVGDAIALATEISRLAEDENLRRNLAENSSFFYSEYLGNQASQERLITCLLED